MSAPVIPIPANIVSLTAAPLLGILFNWGLFGALTVQVYLYAQNFPDDRRWIKCLVYGLYVLEILQTALVTADAMKWFAVGFGDMLALSKPEFSTVDAPILDAIIAVAVQLTFCWRIKVLSESWLLSGAIGAVTIAQVVGAIASGIRIAQLGDLTKMPTITVWVAIWFGGTALADVMIAVAMIVLLARRGGNTSHSSDIVHRLIKLTIETNSLTAIVAVIGFVLTLALPHANYNMCPAYTLGKLYSNTLLVVFNNRIFMARRKESSGAGGSGFDETFGNQSQMPRFAAASTNHPSRYVIEKTKETVVESDLELDDRSQTTKASPIEGPEHV